MAGLLGTAGACQGAGDAGPAVQDTSAGWLGPSSDNLLALAAAEDLPPAADSFVPLDLATPDGSGEVVHPDVAPLDGSWLGWRYWMAVTPYPRITGVAPDRHENPMVVVSNNGVWWATPRAMRNPVAWPTRDSHLSDPDLAYDPASGTLRLYYRETGGTTDQIRLQSSADGRTWNTPQTVLSAGAGTLMSPAVARDTVWRMWTVLADAAGCRASFTATMLRTSPDGTRWTAPRRVDMAPRGHLAWHLDAQWVPAVRQFWALVAAYPVGGSCAGTDLFFAVSGDGATWQVYGRPLWRRAEAPLYAQAVYRSTFHYDANRDEVTVWMSGQGPGGWRVAAVRWARAAMMLRIGAAPSAFTGTRPPL